jgi:hypothetical protein
VGTAFNRTLLAVVVLIEFGANANAADELICIMRKEAMNWNFIFLRKCRGCSDDDVIKVWYGML